MVLANDTYQVNATSPNVTTIQWNNTDASLTALSAAGVQWRQVQRAVGGAHNAIEVYTTASGWQRVEHLGVVCKTDENPAEIYVIRPEIFSRYHEVAP